MNNDFAKRVQKDVRAFYEAHGFSFANTRNGLWPEQILLAKTVRPGMTVIDIGAGNGRFESALPAGADYIGIEPSGSLRDASSAKLIPGELPHLPLAENKGDLTVCFAVLHHIPSEQARKASVQEMIRVTKPGGRIAASAWHLPVNEAFERVEYAQENDVWVPWKAGQETAKRFVHRFTEREWKKLWTCPELEIEKIGLFGKNDWTEYAGEARNFFVMAKKKSA